MENILRIKCYKKNTPMRQIEYTLTARLLNEPAVNNKYEVTSFTVHTEDDKGFTEEQLSLLLSQQLDLTLGTVADIDGIEETNARNFNP